MLPLCHVAATHNPLCINTFCRVAAIAAKIKKYQGGANTHAFSSELLLQLSENSYLCSDETKDIRGKQLAQRILSLEACDTCVLVLPCGRSAHTEAGWFAGKGCTTIAYIPEKQELELMYKLFTAVCCSLDELIALL